MTKTITLLLLFLSSAFIYAQVGIGTTAPTADLDINGTLRVRNLPLSTTNTNFLTTDAIGNVSQSSFYSISDIQTVTASTNIDQTITGISVINNIDLGLSLTIDIPANKEALLLINYSVPIGIDLTTNQPSGAYYGIRFLMDGTEVQAGSRKSSVVLESPGSVSAKMTSISCFYTRYYGASTTDRTITVSLNGYVEQYESPGIAFTYRFNMWNPTGPNYNWGHGTLASQLFLR